MARFRTNNILPIILVLIIAIIAIVALVSIARVLFFTPSSSTKNTAQTDTSRTVLLDTSVSHSVRVTVRGPIVADEAFHSYQIAISSANRSLNTYTGYLDKTVDSVTLANSPAAYEQFVYALDKANLEKGTQLSGDKNDIRGTCATGQIYNFEIIDGSKTVKQLWTSTCKGSKGSLDASVTQLMDLFEAQIPNSGDLINKVDLQTNNSFIY